MAAAPKRPLLPREERMRLNALAVKARRHREERSSDPAYAKGVEDALLWLTGEDMSALLAEVTR
jgi:hypothetical protein